MQFNGLTDEEVIKSRNKYGKNIISKKKKDSFIKIFISQLGDPIIRILVIALFIKLIFLFKDSDMFETIGIFIAIFIASLISSLSEYGSEKTFEKMEELNNNEEVTVIRNGKSIVIGVSDIVVDDIVLLESGDKVCADIELLSGSINVDESSLTGETIGKDKKIKDIIYKGTTIYNGNGIGKVIKIGDKTMYGEVASLVQEEAPISPLKIRLSKLASTISKIGYVSAFLVSFSYLFRVLIIENNFDYNMILNTINNFPLFSSYLIYALTLSVTTIVVSVPEGLPMMVALVLSSNMKRMLKKGVLVRKLVGIETAGSLNVLFTDKTGTLTKGELNVTSFIDGEGNNYTKSELINLKIYDYIKTSILYNTSSNINNDEIIGGNITEKALLKFIGKSNKNKKVIDFIPFNSTNKYSKVKLDNGITYIKGAREILLDKCSYYIDKNGDKKIINKLKFESIIKREEIKGNRVLCFCITSLPYDNNDLTLIGFTVIKDEIREGIIESIREVKQAGINVVMVTGDNKDTACTIAKEVGIIESEKEIVLDSKELNKLSDEDVKKILPNLRVVARLLPADKTRLINLSEEINLVTGMTGDGVNDAPALKKADVGFAIGSGCEVAKEASDIVIINNDFKSISSSILFGRTIFKSIRKFIIFQLTVNMCAITLSVVGPFIGIETPVTVIQMLWINMVMDTLAALAFAYEPPLKEYMLELPKKKNENVINRYMASEIFITGLYTSIMCIIFLKSSFIGSIYRVNETNSFLMTAFFGLFIFSSIFNSFNARTHRLNLISNINKNKVFIIIILFIIVVQLYLIYFGGNVFRTTGLTFIELDIMILISFSVIPFDLFRKIILRLLGKKGGV